MLYDVGGINRPAKRYYEEGKRAEARKICALLTREGCDSQIRRPDDHHSATPKPALNPDYVR